MAKEKPLEVKRDKGRIWSYLRQAWLHETPEERVRQEYLTILVNEYGFTLDHIGEEIPVTGRGSGNARADFLVWRSAEDKKKTDKPHPLIVVECKADNVAIDQKAYTQGSHYAQYCGARFFVCHNHRETRYFKVDHDRMAPNYLEIENIPHADASDREIDVLIARLKTFKEEEFADLLHKCHNIIRNREAHDPTKAFDETAKILFVKVWVERELKTKKRRKNIFNVEFLDEQLSDDPLNDFFEKTKKHYEKDALFAADERINLKPETGKEIVRQLQSYNLSDTSEDIKGIAFERFLGRTFRGEIGQFFTPRPIVEFMVQMLDPKEGETVCDPASGSGGFLIRVFEIVRQKIMEDIDREYRKYKKQLDADKKLKEAERARLLSEKYAELQATVEQKHEGSRLWDLSNRCLYGTDKNDRMARTSKMNMIMHGDGHGGVHHWNGFLNVNGIFPGRFKLILTNPPFGAKVEADEKIVEAEIALPDSVEEHYEKVYGPPYRLARNALKAAVGKSIASLFQLPANEGSKIKTEILFIERCLDLLEPGGRMGIVLPEGVFNNPSLAYVRQFVENRARILAVVSLPQETFYSSGASVKASLLFLKKFEVKEQAKFDAVHEQATAETRALYADELARLKEVLDKPKPVLADFTTGNKPTADEKRASKRRLDEAVATQKAEKAKAATALKALEARIADEARALLKQRFNYPIFLYEAEKVGITATGESDANELYPNDRIPPGITKTVVELYREFAKDPKPFFV